MTGLTHGWIGATLALGMATPGAFHESVAWIIAGTMLALAAVCWWLRRRAGAKAATATARNAPLQAALDKALGRIRGFSDSQERFVGNLAQEISSPLAAVLVHVNLLLAGSQEPASVQRYARRVAEDTRYVSELVESFLRLARPLAGEHTSHHVPVHVHDLVLESVHRCRSLASTRSVSVVPMLAEPGEDAAVEVLGDAVLLEAMIENLVRNAVLAAPRGSRVVLHVSIRSGTVRLAVRDHGEKIDNDQLESVFGGFFQVASPPRPTVGTGLGLAIAKRVAEHHHGTISLRNMPEGGCEFAVELPRWRPERPPEASATGLVSATRPGAR
jgi:signal transduction histidine kinase